MVDSPRALVPLSKKTVLKIEQINVPGRKNIVTAAIVIIDELSRCVAIDILEVRLAISKFVRLSLWAAKLKKRLIQTLVLSL